MSLGRERLSFNQITADHLDLEQAVDACVDSGIAWFGPWRQKLGPGAAEKIRNGGLRVSSLCRGGFFPAVDPAGRAERDEDNRIAVDQAADSGPTSWSSCVVRRPTAISRGRDARCWRASSASSRTPRSRACAWESSRCTR